jgi:hypothetical protein
VVAYVSGQEVLKNPLNLRCLHLSSLPVPNRLPRNRLPTPGGWGVTRIGRSRLWATKPSAFEEG